MAAEKVGNNALSNLIKEEIVEDLLLGKLKPGDKLVEAKYAEKYGISRAPVREAFYLLSLEGFLEKIPRKETVVKGYSKEELFDLLRIRMFLEELAIEKLSIESLDKIVPEMHRILEEMKKASDSRVFAQLNHDFHFQIIIASNSDVLKNMYDRKLSVPLLSLHRVALMEAEKKDRSLTEHQEIVDLLESGDIERAKKALKLHSNNFLLLVKKNLSKKEHNIRNLK